MRLSMIHLIRKNKNSNLIIYLCDGIKWQRHSTDRLIIYKLLHEIYLIIGTVRIIAFVIMYYQNN